MEVTVFLILLLAGTGAADTSRASLLRFVLNEAKTVVPKANISLPVAISVELNIVSLANVDETSGEVDLIMWTTYQWEDPSLKWDPAKWGGINQINIPADAIWTPDTIFFNLRRPSQALAPQRVIVYRGGSVLYVPSERITVGCSLTGIKTDSGADCTLKFGSWTYSGHDVDLSIGGNNVLREYIRGPRYNIVEASVNRTEMFYPCCPEPYVHLTLSMNIE